MLAASRDRIRSDFYQYRRAPPKEARERIANGMDVVRFLRRNVVQGVKKGEDGGGIFRTYCPVLLFGGGEGLIFELFLGGGRVEDS